MYSDEEFKALFNSDRVQKDKPVDPEREAALRNALKEPAPGSPEWWRARMHRVT